MQEGRYCPGEEGKCVKFYVKENPKGGGIFYFTPPVRDIVSLFEYNDPYDKGDFLNVTQASYATFLDNVVNKNTEWTNVVNALPGIGNVNPQTIPGTWSWLSEDETEMFNKGMDDAVGSKPVYSSAAARRMTGITGGSSRKSKRIHRKPTKRRRNRRGNRKTKKI